MGFRQNGCVNSTLVEKKIDQLTLIYRKHGLSSNSVQPTPLLSFKVKNNDTRAANAAKHRGFSSRPRTRDAPVQCKTPRAFGRSNSPPRGRLGWFFFIERRPRQPDMRRRSRVAFSLWNATLPNCPNYAPNQRLFSLVSAVTRYEESARRCSIDA